MSPTTSALDLDKRIAKYKKGKYSDLCEKFERKHKMNSDTFMEKFESGQLDDRDEFFDWYAAKKGFEKWCKKSDILSGIQVRSAKQAIHIASETLEDAGVVVYVITEATLTESTWHVQASALFSKFFIDIDANTGDILSFTSEFK